MAKCAHHPGSGCRAAPQLIAAVALALLLTACSDADGIETSAPRTDAPSGTSTTESSSDSISQAAVEREVTDRYVTFQRIVAETGATSDADDPRLAEYATGAVLANLRGKCAVRQRRRAHASTARRSPTCSPSRCQVTARPSSTADNSATGLLDKAGKKLSVGQPRGDWIDVGDSRLSLTELGRHCWSLLDEFAPS